MTLQTFCLQHSKKTCFNKQSDMKTEDCAMRLKAPKKLVSGALSRDCHKNYFQSRCFDILPTSPPYKKENANFLSEFECFNQPINHIYLCFYTQTSV